MLFPPPGAPSIRIVLGLGRKEDRKHCFKPFNGSLLVCFSSCHCRCGREGSAGGKVSKFLGISKRWFKATSSLWLRIVSIFPSCANLIISSSGPPRRTTSSLIIASCMNSHRGRWVHCWEVWLWDIDMYSSLRY